MGNRNTVATYSRTMIFRSKFHMLRGGHHDNAKGAGGTGSWEGESVNRSAEKDLALYNLATKGKWKLSDPHWHKGCHGRDCKQSIYAEGVGTIAIALGAQYRGWNEDSPNYTKLNSLDGECIVMMHQALPYWINRAVELEKQVTELKQRQELKEKYGVSCLCYQCADPYCKGASS